MLKITLYALAGLALLVVLALAGLSLMSRRVPDLGTIEGQLRACPDSPNCVSSERPDANAYVPPLRIDTDPDPAWQRVREAVKAMGGEIQREDDGYLWATFRTPLWRFVDDLELRLAPEKDRIHIRSASRVGHSDLGANRQRVEQLRSRFARTGPAN